MNVLRCGLFIGIAPDDPTYRTDETPEFSETTLPSSRSTD